MLLARLSDTLNAEVEAVGRRNKELRCELARKSADLERVKELCGLEEEREGGRDCEKGGNRLTEWTSLLEESEALQQSIASLQTQLSSLQSPSDSLALLALLESKALKEGQLTASRTLCEQATAELGRLESFWESTQAKKANFGAKIEQIDIKIRSLKAKITELESDKASNLADLCILPPHLVGYFKDLETRRSQDTQTLLTKRKEWKFAESALIERYEEEVKTLEKELEEVGGGEKSVQRPMMRRKKAEKEEGGLDLESLLGHSGPTLQRIQEVARQYRSSTKEDPGF